MKKAILFVVGLILLSMLTNAGVLYRNNGNEPGKTKEANGSCFDAGTRIINLGVGFGGFNYYKSGLGGGYTYKSTPAFSLTYEQAYPKKLGPGYLGIGAYFGYKRAQSRYDNSYYLGERYYYEHNWNYMVIAARGAYHWDVLNAKNAEVYAGAIVGVRITTYSYKTNSIDPNINLYESHNQGVYPVLSLFAGARWYFVQNVALFGEAGYGISYLTGGFSFKF
jgi:hypothetical protein